MRVAIDEAGNDGVAAAVDDDRVDGSGGTAGDADVVDDAVDDDDDRAGESHATPRAF